ncbi:hypothetical protein [Cohnella abietis]|uniref:Uncharacterized protein n=1 Tax=Cohnella abietis TaxID=2507935 RepID=A0A3T1D6Z1_9BACL|nr:hypothetical protein [Cohnella abietis]BBI33860.1 hypothetical protein KCTCHS21_32590 [Cohnella abietis]
MSRNAAARARNETIHIVNVEKGKRIGTDPRLLEIEEKINPFGLVAHVTRKKEEQRKAGVRENLTSGLMQGELAKVKRVWNVLLQVHSLWSYDVGIYYCPIIVHNHVYRYFYLYYRVEYSKHHLIRPPLFGGIII